MRIPSYQICLALVILFYNKPASAQNVFNIHDTNTALRITSSVYLHSEFQEKPIDSIRNLPSRSWSLNHSDQMIRIGITNKLHWISWKTTGGKKSALNWLLRVNNKGINRLELFYEENGVMNSLGFAGDSYPFKQTSLPSTYSIFKLPKLPVDTVRYILFVDKKNENLQFSLDLVPENLFYKQYDISLLFIGFFTGILLLGCCISFYVFFVFKEKLNFWYALYILSIINLLFSYERIDFQYFYPDFPFYTNISRFISSSITLSLMMLVMQLFCNQRPSNSRYYYWVNVIRYTILSGVPITFVVYYFFPWFEVKRIHFVVFISLQIVGIAVIFISCMEKIIQKYNPAIFYFAAVVTLLITGLMATMQEIGFIHYSTRTPNMLQIGFILEVILISMGMLFRYNLIKKENELLFNELNEQKLKSVRQLLDIQSKEQQRIAEDLHDLLGGQLAVIKMKVSGLLKNNQEKELLINLIDDVTITTRGIAHNMVPVQLGENDLIEVISSYIRQLNDEQNIKFEFILTGIPKYLTKEEEASLYKIVMELIQNILIHSQASDAILQFFFKEDELEIVIEDNGVGFIFSTKMGMGFKNIRKRLEPFGGNIHVDSTPGNTTIIIFVPLNK